MLEGILKSIKEYDNDFLEIDASTKEIIKSSQIEGELLNRDSIPLPNIKTTFLTLPIDGNDEWYALLLIFAIMPTKLLLFSQK
jgi:hypothetical protein